MRINDSNTSVRGFFIYSPDAEYELGDFVVKGNTIYVCSPTNGNPSCIGEDPAISENYTVYLGDKTTSTQDFINFVNGKDEDGEERLFSDRYISLSHLPAILNNYMTGLTTSGVIGDYISYNDENDFEVNISVFEKDSMYDYSTSDSMRHILSDLILSNINHGIFRVSRALPEIAEYVYQASSSDANDQKFRDCILKQYTYNSTDFDGIIRVQEIIDHQDGHIFYRTVPIPNTELGYEEAKKIAKHNIFKFATVHTSSLQHKANHLFETYYSRMSGFQARLEELYRDFSFTSIPISIKPREINGNIENVITFQTDSPEESNYIKDFDSVGPMTVNVSSIVKQEAGPSGVINIYDNKTVSFDPAFRSAKYYISDDLYLDVTVGLYDNSEDGGNIKSSTIKIFNYSGFQGLALNCITSNGGEFIFNLDTFSENYNNPTPYSLSATGLIMTDEDTQTSTVDSTTILYLNKEDSYFNNFNAISIKAILAIMPESGISSKPNFSTNTSITKVFERNCYVKSHGIENNIYYDIHDINNPLWEPAAHGNPSGSFFDFSRDILLSGDEYKLEEGKVFCLYLEPAVVSQKYFEVINKIPDSTIKLIHHYKGNANNNPLILNSDSPNSGSLELFNDPERGFYFEILNLGDAINSEIYFRYFFNGNRDELLSHEDVSEIPELIETYTEPGDESLKTFKNPLISYDSILSVLEKRNKSSLGISIHCAIKKEITFKVDNNYSGENLEVIVINLDEEITDYCLIGSGNGVNNTGKVFISDQSTVLIKLEHTKYFPENRKFYEISLETSSEIIAGQDLLIVSGEFLLPENSYEEISYEINSTILEDLSKVTKDKEIPVNQGDIELYQDRDLYLFQYLPFSDSYRIEHGQSLTENDYYNFYEGIGVFYKLEEGGRILYPENFSSNKVSFKHKIISISSNKDFKDPSSLIKDIYITFKVDLTATLGTRTVSYGTLSYFGDSTTGEISNFSFKDININGGLTLIKNEDGIFKTKFICLPLVSDNSEYYYLNYPTLLGENNPIQISTKEGIEVLYPSGDNDLSITWSKEENNNSIGYIYITNKFIDPDEPLEEDENSDILIYSKINLDNLKDDIIDVKNYISQTGSYVIGSDSNISKYDDIFNSQGKENINVQNLTKFTIFALTSGDSNPIKIESNETHNFEILHSDTRFTFNEVVPDNPVIIGAFEVTEGDDNGRLFSYCYYGGDLNSWVYSCGVPSVFLPMDLFNTKDITIKLQEIKMNLEEGDNLLTILEDLGIKSRKLKLTTDISRKKAKSSDTNANKLEILYPGFKIDYSTYNQTFDWSSEESYIEIPIIPDLDLFGLSFRISNLSYSSKLTLSVTVFLEGDDYKDNDEYEETEDFSLIAGSGRASLTYFFGNNSNPAITFGDLHKIEERLFNRLNKKEFEDDFKFGYKAIISETPQIITITSDTDFSGNLFSLEFSTSYFSDESDRWKSLTYDPSIGKFKLELTGLEGGKGKGASGINFYDDDSPTEFLKIRQKPDSILNPFAVRYYKTGLSSETSINNNSSVFFVCQDVDNTNEWIIDINPTIPNDTSNNEGGYNLFGLGRDFFSSDSCNGQISLGIAERESYVKFILDEKYDSSLFGSPCFPLGKIGVGLSNLIPIYPERSDRGIWVEGSSVLPSGTYQISFIGITYSPDGTEIVDESFKRTPLIINSGDIITASSRKNPLISYDDTKYFRNDTNVDAIKVSFTETTKDVIYFVNNTYLAGNSRIETPTSSNKIFLREMNSGWLESYDLNTNIPSLKSFESLGMSGWSLKLDAFKNYYTNPNNSISIDILYKDNSDNFKTLGKTLQVTPKYLEEKNIKSYNINFSFESFSEKGYTDSVFYNHPGWVFLSGYKIDDVHLSYDRQNFSSTTDNPYDDESTSTTKNPYYNPTVSPLEPDYFSIPNHISISSEIKDQDGVFTIDGKEYSLYKFAVNGGPDLKDPEDEYCIVDFSELGVYSIPETLIQKVINYELENQCNIYFVVRKGENYELCKFNTTTDENNKNRILSLSPGEIIIDKDYCKIEGLSDRKLFVIIGGINAVSDRNDTKFSIGLDEKDDTLFNPKGELRYDLTLTYNVFNPGDQLNIEQDSIKIFQSLSSGGEATFYRYGPFEESTSYITATFDGRNDLFFIYDFLLSGNSISTYNHCFKGLLSSYNILNYGKEIDTANNRIFNFKLSFSLENVSIFDSNNKNTQTITISNNSDLEFCKLKLLSLPEDEKNNNSSILQKQLVIPPGGSFITKYLDSERSYNDNLSGAEFDIFFDYYSTVFGFNGEYSLGKYKYLPYSYGNPSSPKEGVGPILIRSTSGYDKEGDVLWNPENGGTIEIEVRSINDKEEEDLEGSTTSTTSSTTSTSKPVSTQSPKMSRGIDNSGVSIAMLSSDEGSFDITYGLTEASEENPMMARSRSFSMRSSSDSSSISYAASTESDTLPGIISGIMIKLGGNRAGSSQITSVYYRKFLK